MKWIVVLLIASASVIAALILRSLSGDVLPKKVDVPESSVRTETAATEEDAPRIPQSNAESSPAVPAVEPASADVAKKPPAFGFMESIEPATRTLVERVGSGSSIDTFLNALGYTPPVETVDQIARTIAELDQTLAEQLAGLDHERLWNLSDPVQRVEHSRRREELEANQHEQRYERLRPLVRPSAFSRAYEAWTHGTPDEKK